MAIPFVMTYHPGVPKVKEIVNRHLSIIDSSERMKRVIAKKPVMAYRRPKSLEDVFGKARLPQDFRSYEQYSTWGVKALWERACSCCNVMTPTLVAKSSNGTPVKLKHQTNCKSKEM